MLLETPNDNVESLKFSIKNMDDINATFFNAEETTSADPVIGYTGFLNLEGADNPGIVYKVTNLLARHNLSIQKMKTSDEIAPHGGATLFHMQAVVHAFEPMAREFDISKVQSDLEAVGDSLNCNISLEPMQENDDFEVRFGS
eukprot:CAMPEP_0202441782 /NCGR_PEP_ID=MMETSP1360-20130828/1288_1 /ASSEMBLY_ACC=CAM_ASM_000848 /TAXON_ID=515479 /ORGANISM="Licmophora paradoxa, Strain CCMP2313" /LENGTH=142 /DNA_ID=CAMNT_0049056919 /DNA_START=375 /DNA_END=803 /DNA_ORIENTATION=+